MMTYRKIFAEKTGAAHRRAVGHGVCILLVLAAFAAIAPLDALAQRPIQMFDPFYRGESASRTFYDSYAVTAELSYRPRGLLQGDDAVGGGLASGIGSDPVGLNLLFEYQLTPSLDAGAYVDASGSAAGRTLGINWLQLKYFRHEEGTDYAIRLAVDPSSDARGGFPQMDLGFLYESLLSPTVSTDFAIGVRRVHVGFQELTTDNLLLRNRAIGWEMHVSTSYRIVFDPAGSNMFIHGLVQGGSYDLVEWVAGQAERSSTDYQGGVIWLRSGLDIKRPSYQFEPYLSIPVSQWAPSEGEWPRNRARVGVRFMIR